MKAWQVQSAANRTIEDLVLAEVPEPQITATELLVKMHVVGLNPVDYKVIENGIDSWQYPHTVGIDAVGEVVALGEQTSGFNIGDRVFYHGDLRRDGSLAEFAATDFRGVGHVPDTMSDEQASAILCSAMTAYQALYRKANLVGKQTILIHAGGGNVGFIGIQLAKKLGLTVIATTSARKRELVTQAGADVIIDYHAESVTERVLETTNQLGVDLSLNTIGQQEIAHDIDRMAYNGQILVVGDGIPEGLDLDGRALTIARIALGGVYRSDNGAQIHDLAIMAESLATMVMHHELVAPVDRLVPMQDVKAAMATVKAGTAQGKISVKVQ